MKFFATSDMDVSVNLKETIGAQDNWNTEFVPEKILDSVIDDAKQIFVRVKWSGFSELECTWEPIKSFYYDAPDLVHAFLEEHVFTHKHLRDYVEKRT
jgi:hypothetical protein